MTNMAGDVSGRAGQHWDKLESIFEERIAKAMKRLGVPSAKDVEALVARIDELSASVAQVSAAPGPAKKAAAKKAAARARREEVRAHHEAARRAQVESGLKAAAARRQAQGAGRPCSVARSGIAPGVAPCRALTSGERIAIGVGRPRRPGAARVSFSNSPQ